MIIALHGPDSITVFSERLLGIGTDSGINKYRNRVYIQRERSYIIMVMAFVIESAFGSEQHTILIFHVAEFSFGIPGNIRHIVFRSRFYQVITTKQGLKGTKSVIAHSSVRLSAIQQVSCKMHHFITADRFTETVNQQRITPTLCRSIGEVHYPAIAYVGTGHIFPHPANHRFIKQGYLASCTIGKNLEIIIEFSGSMSPIRGSFFTSAIGLYEINEFIHRLHRTINGFGQLVLIIFHQEETLQSIGITPRIPVIDNFSRLPVESHPPHFIIIHIRIENTFFDCFTHL